MKKKVKRSLTLLEMMIVILLIGLIGSVLSYHLKGALDQGKKFKTEEGMRRLKSILELQVMQGFCSIQDLEGESTRDIVKECLLDSHLISSQTLKTFIVDGWGNPYHLSIVDDELEVISSKLKDSK
ncbi:type II secretion system protein [Rhabdochlamydiaceae symbiont of Dictyostelium giganteum]|uniref:type II secretion system protein n=1 Tax=Rhabdochlamydiaceae symbiont of Dictyostelium giganteum TaxID=3342349 RepID=UPI00384F5F09